MLGRWRGLGRAPMPGRRGRAMPGSWGLAAIGKKSCRSSPPQEDWIFFFGKNPDLGAGLAGLRCRAGAAGEASMPGSGGEASMPGRRGRASMPGRRGRVAQRQAV